MTTTLPVRCDESRCAVVDWSTIDPVGSADGYARVVGGCLCAVGLLEAHRHGFLAFPAPDQAAIETNRVLYGPQVAAGRTLRLDRGRVEPYSLTWFNPARRPRLRAGELRLPLSLGRQLRNRLSWTTTVDQRFAEVVQQCSVGRPRSWLTPQLALCLVQLHEQGWAHSVEVWDDEGDLVAGVVGVGVGRTFSCDTMFHRASGAGRCAVTALAHRLPADVWLDLQWTSDFASSLGAVPTSRTDHLATMRDDSPLVPRTGRAPASALCLPAGARRGRSSGG